MTYRLTHRMLAGVSLLISFIVYMMTMAPTTSFWDCGEFIATSVIMGVPHPPGTPLYLLVGNFFSQLPTYSDIGARVNVISPLLSALAVMLTYLIIVQLIEEFRGSVNSRIDALITYGSGFIGALTFAVTDSHWFNAVEAEVYSASTFFTAIVIWLILRWSQNEGKPGNVRYILIIAYIFGLAIGIHLLNLLALPCIALIIYYRKYRFSILSFLVVIVLTLVTFTVIYLGVIKGLPNLADRFGLFAPVAAVIFVVAAMVYSIYNEKHISATIFTSLVLILIGFSTYTTIFIRANQRPAINENNPDTFERAVMYMNREQYGTWSVTDRAATLQRPECSYWKRWTANRANPSGEEVARFVWEYQVKEMYLRYFAWQFIGRGDLTWPVENLQGNLIKFKEGVNWFRYGLPLAFLLGLWGFVYHFRKDWKRALAVLALFLLTGLLIIIYLNQYDPQPRERDYSYVGSFFAFSLWIGIGLSGLLDSIRKFFKRSAGQGQFAVIGFLTLIFVLVPVKMLATDYHEHDRTDNFVAWDYAYNMLNSCEPNAVLFTNGDNDTFPLWYLQEVRGIRKDVRVVNLSLLNTSWYAFQLRDDPPTLPITMSDREIEKLMPIPWEAREVTAPGPTKSDPPIVWNLRPTYAGQFLRVQDLMIYRIIKDLKWKYPIYFAVTVSPENQIGLDNYLQMEGLAYKLHPKKVEEINYDRMLQLISETENPDQLIVTGEDWLAHMASGDGVYRYRNLDDPQVYYNHNIQRLIQNYRSSYLRLALENVYTQESAHQEEAYRLLREMEGHFPSESLPINNPDLEIQIAHLYQKSGDFEEFRKRIDRVTMYQDLPLETTYYLGQLYLKELNDAPRAIVTFKSLYDDPRYRKYFDIMVSLAEAYVQSGQISQARQVVESWLIEHPEDKDAKDMLQVLQEHPDGLPDDSSATTN